MISFNTYMCLPDGTLSGRVSLSFSLVDEEKDKINCGGNQEYSCHVN